jgi:lipopolysaccharide export system protein LptA
LNAGELVLLGEVSIVQGTMESHAAKATVFSKDGEVVRVLLEGSPATLQQQTENNGGLMHASANQVDYLVENNQVVLRGDAKLNRATDTMQAANITYAVDSGQVDAAGDGSGGLVAMQLQPKPRKPASEKTDDKKKQESP